MATPFVAGAAALASQKWHTATSASLVTWLRDRTQDIDTENPNYAGELGGLLDIADALQISGSSANTPEEPETPETSDDGDNASTPDGTELPSDEEEYQLLIPLIVVQ